MAVDLALEAERAGWDGFFVYDHIVIVHGRQVPSFDPWSVLAIVAKQTSLVLGPMITPVARRQPWELALQTATVDRLSQGRFILGVGLGERADYESFGDRESDRRHAERLDEGLTILRELWAGRTVTHRGSWELSDVALAPGPLAGTIPIWVGGRYGARRPLTRAARFDGMFPINREWHPRNPLAPGQVREIRRSIKCIRGSLDGFELATAGTSPPTAEAAAVVEPYAIAGATWWFEIFEPRRGTLDEMRERVAAGPPTLA